MSQSKLVAKETNLPEIYKLLFSMISLFIPNVLLFEIRKVMALPPDLQEEINKFRVEGFAETYFNAHKRGLFRRRIPVDKLLEFQKVYILSSYLSHCLLSICPISLTW